MNHSNTRTPAPLPAGITREVLEQDGLRAIMRQSQPEVALTDDTTMRASIAATLAARPSEPQAGNGVWLFGYGSLLWNPCVPVAQWEIGRIHGYHRDFRIRLDHGRGSPDAPGLMLGLAPGGSCVGMGMRIAAQDLEHELLMIWRREMLTGVYRPRWVRMHGVFGRVPAITFVINPRHPSCREHLDQAKQIHMLATGSGWIGSCAEYLENTLAQLDEHGIHDRHMHMLQREVTQYQAEHGVISPAGGSR